MENEEPWAPFVDSKWKYENKTAYSIFANIFSKNAHICQIFVNNCSNRKFLFCQPAMRLKEITVSNFVTVL